jgi:uncharacterized protein (DUF2147 family)
LVDDKYIELLESEELEETKGNSVIDLKENYIYGAQISVKDETKINELKRNCKDLVDITKQIIYG